MSSLQIASIIFGCVFGGALLGVGLRTIIPEPRLSADTRDAIKLAVAIVATMSALILGLLLMMLPITPAWAAETADNRSTPIVGIVEAPPFATKDGDGNWDGIAVRLWRHVAGDFDLQYELREMSPADLLAGLQDGKLTAVVTAVVTAEREPLVDSAIPTIAPVSASPSRKRPRHPTGWPSSATLSRGRSSRSSAC